MLNFIVSAYFYCPIKMSQNLDQIDEHSEKWSLTVTIILDLYKVPLSRKLF